MKRKRTILRTVGVAGCQERIGTTTQTLQIVKYLQLMGYRACYVEMNGHSYIKGCQELYTETVYTPKTGKVCVQGVDMYPQEQIKQANQADYEFYIKDYGSVREPDFASLSFLEQDTRIFCAGLKPNEIEPVLHVLEQPKFDDSGFVFSFVPCPDREAVRDMMEDRRDFTFFAEYIPDPFLYTALANNNYKALLGL